MKDIVNIILVVALVLLLASCGKREDSADHRGEIQVWCKVTSVTDSLERQSCGKACTRTVWVITYQCPAYGAIKQ